MKRTTQIEAMIVEAYKEGDRTKIDLLTAELSHIMEQQRKKERILWENFKMSIVHRRQLN